MVAIKNIKSAQKTLLFSLLLFSSFHSNTSATQLTHKERKQKPLRAKDIIIGVATVGVVIGAVFLFRNWKIERERKREIDQTTTFIKDNILLRRDKMLQVANIRKFIHPLSDISKGLEYLFTLHGFHPKDKSQEDNLIKNIYQQAKKARPTEVINDQELIISNLPLSENKIMQDSRILSIEGKTKDSGYSQGKTIKTKRDMERNNILLPRIVNDKLLIDDKVKDNLKKVIGNNRNTLPVKAFINFYAKEEKVRITTSMSTSEKMKIIERELILFDTQYPNKYERSEEKKLFLWHNFKYVRNKERLNAFLVTRKKLESEIIIFINNNHLSAGEKEIKNILMQKIKGLSELHYAINRERDEDENKDLVAYLYRRVKQYKRYGSLSLQGRDIGC